MAGFHVPETNQVPSGTKEIQSSILSKNPLFVSFVSFCKIRAPLASWLFNPSPFRYATSPMSSKLTNIELTIFGFFASLTVKAVLDTAYGKTVPLLATPFALYHAAWSPVSIQVVVMVFTFMRFVYGIYRLHEGHNELDTLETWVIVWITPSLVVLLILFYIAGLCVPNPEAFYAALIGVHAWDIVAFLLPMALSKQLKGHPIRHTFRRFLALDFLTVLVLTAVVLAMDNVREVSYIGAAAMVLFGIADFWWNHDFFFPPQKPVQG
jgi:hypothetical protein